MKDGIAKEWESVLTFAQLVMTRERELRLTFAQLLTIGSKFGPTALLGRAGGSVPVCSADFESGAGLGSPWYALCVSVTLFLPLSLALSVCLSLLPSPYLSVSLPLPVCLSVSPLSEDRQSDGKVDVGRSAGYKHTGVHCYFGRTPPRRLQRGRCCRCSLRPV